MVIIFFIYIFSHLKLVIFPKILVKFNSYVVTFKNEIKFKVLYTGFIVQRDFTFRIGEHNIESENSVY